MFAWLAQRSDLQKRAAALHDAIVEDARAPHLYTALGVPDTTDGRLEMLALHVVLMLDRLGRIGADGQKLAQAVTETYIVAMDDAMRAIGVGDLAVPRKVKKAAAALYDRHQAYGPAMAASRAGREGEAMWRDALATILGPLPGVDAIDQAALAHYADARVQTLATVTDATLLAGRR